MASKKKQKKPVEKRPARGPKCPRCEKHADLFWHGRRELCQACIDAVRTPLETEPITFGSLVRGTLDLVKRVGVHALAITLLFQLPLTAITVTSEAGTAIAVAWAFVALIAMGMIIDVALQHVTDGRVSMGGAIRRALGVYIGLLFAALVSQILVLAFALLLVVPGIMRALSYAIVFPLILDGDATSTDALGVSKERMKGHRWPALFAFLAVYALPAIWFGVNLDVALAGLAPDAPLPEDLAVQSAIYTLVDAILAIPVTLLGVVLHLKLRMPTPA